MKFHYTLLFIKASLFFVIGVLIFALQHILNENIGLLVGCNLILNGIVYLITLLIKKSLKTEYTDIYDALINVVLGLMVCLLIRDEFDKVCMVWAVWTIARQSKNVYALYSLGERHKWFIIVNAVEAVVITVFSILLMLHTTPEHAATHVLILGAEFLFESLFTLDDYFFIKKNPHHVK